MTVSLLAMTEACGNEPSATCRFIYDLTENVSAARSADILFRPFKAGLIVLVAALLVRLLRKLIDRTVGRITAAQARSVTQSSKDDADQAPARVRELVKARRAARAAQAADRGRQRAETIGLVLKNTATVFLYSVAILVALGEFNINLGPLIASAGIVGVALGFGAQSLVKDFLSGIFMFLEDQYGVGDVVDVGEVSGLVEAVSLRTTRIRDVDGTLWYFPNGEIRRVGNKSQQWARAILDVEVAYNTDLSKAMGVIKLVAEQVWREGIENATIIEEPEIWGVEAFGENSMVIRLAIKTEASEQWSTARLVRRRLKEAFDREGIETPFPHRTGWVRHPGNRPDSLDREAAD